VDLVSAAWGPVARKRGGSSKVIIELLAGVHPCRSSAAAAESALALVFFYFLNILFKSALSFQVYLQREWQAVGGASAGCAGGGAGQRGL
jgi:hypothetical protein